jgi:hypothetical protein
MTVLLSRKISRCLTRISAKSPTSKKEKARKKRRGCDFHRLLSRALSRSNFEIEKQQTTI